ncbi:hypothetical protein SYNTR_0741 [Candidatus Syntrophocurvum alkaliphilum]|uniref:Calcineurin-like phosphoesterase domain-containing protein n=1 Tax=Candidatus Syntrophocurvum alkaliphilum TaxID=2293317 RepID=A0A6I6DFC6_9FIRM|nr:metallophosphoesterase family protein [Candidatus Syntrophocurvum alkaliphilum]QGT99334.1 hypothetical protein SYNTR_0741 [Candidatus Syntrophocurvum alkaliphilum]
MFKNCNLLIHARDIGTVILDKFETIAPVVAVKGNIDKGDCASFLPLINIVELKNTFIYILHDIKELDIDPKAFGFNITINRIYFISFQKPH